MRELRLHVHGMDCAEEAALIRRALDRDEGVTSLDFDLIHSFVQVKYDDGRTNATAIANAVRRTGLTAHDVSSSGEPGDASLHTHAHHHPHGRYSTLSTIVSGVLLLVGWAIEGFTAEHWTDTFVRHAHDTRAAVFYGLSAAIGLGPMWSRAVASLRHLHLDMHVLVCLSVIGAAAIGEWSEGAAVAFLFALAHRMEAWSIERARAEIAALVGRSATRVAAGLHESAAVERWIERFAAVYTPCVTGAAVVVAVLPPLIDGQWAEWFYRALVFLVLGCPCALIISTPVTVVAALSSAARRGVLIKGGAALERAATASEPSRAGLGAAGVLVASARTAAGVEPAALSDADVVLTTSDEAGLPFLVAHARRALGVIRQNVAMALLTKVAFLAAAPFGVAPLWMAVLADTGATVMVTLNALRLLSAR